ncbi:MAG TPA: hypothetical protein VF885_01695 [Arthrobacter sp.]
MDTRDLLAHATVFAFRPAGTTADTFEIDAFTVLVSLHAGGLWAVTWAGHCWNGTGWEHSSPPSHKKAFLRRCRFSRDEAVRIASGLPDLVNVNGRTWAQWQDLFASTAPGELAGN